MSVGSSLYMQHVSCPHHPVSTDPWVLYDTDVEREISQLPPQASGFFYYRIFTFVVKVDGESIAARTKAIPQGPVYLVDAEVIGESDESMRFAMEVSLRTQGIQKTVGPLNQVRVRCGCTMHADLEEHELISSTS